MIKLISPLKTQELRDLLLELRQVGKSETPVQEKLTLLLQKLFLVSDGSWLDKYFAIDTYLKAEIINRFLNFQISDINENSN